MTGLEVSCLDAPTGAAKSKDRTLVCHRPTYLHHARCTSSCMECVMSRCRVDNLELSIVIRTECLDDAIRTECLDDAAIHT